MAKPKNITWRKESGSYQVRITRNGKKYSDSFSAKKHGSKAKALLAATVWRDAELKRLGPPAPSGSTPGIKTRRNQSGTVNVIFRDRNKQKLKDSSECWIAKLRGCRPSSLTWNAKKYGGVEEAYVLAVLTVELGRPDREAVLARFQRIRNKRRYRAIADRMSW